MQEVRQRPAQVPRHPHHHPEHPGFNIGGSNFDIDYVIRGPELSPRWRPSASSCASAPSRWAACSTSPTTLRLDRPELRVQVDRERAADLRVDVEQIATALRLMVGGDQEVSRFHDPFLDQDYDVQLRLSAADRSDPGPISRLYVSRASAGSATALGAAPQVGLAPGGGLVRLDSVVKIAPAQTASRIDRSERQRENRLRGVIAPATARPTGWRRLSRSTAEMNLPAGYVTSISGRGREFEGRSSSSSGSSCSP